MLMARRLMSVRGAERRSNLHIRRGDTRFATLAHALSRAAAHLPRVQVPGSAGEQIAARTLVPGVVSDHAGEYRCCSDTERLAMSLDMVTY